MIHLSCVTWNRLELTRRCLESLFAHTDGEYTLTIVDNGNTDGRRLPSLSMAKWSPPLAR